MQGRVEAAALGWVWKHPQGKMLRLWAPWRQVWITVMPAFRTSCFLFYLFMTYPITKRISGSSLVVLFQHTHTHTHTHTPPCIFIQTRGSTASGWKSFLRRKSEICTLISIFKCCPHISFISLFSKESLNIYYLPAPFWALGIQTWIKPAFPPSRISQCG